MKYFVGSPFWFLCIALVGLVCFPQFAYADMPAGVCSTDPTFNIPANINIIQTIVNQIECILYGGADCGGGGASLAQNLFVTMIGGPDSNYGRVITASLTLFVIIFAISFMLGIIQLSLVEFTIRALKFTFVAIFVTGYAWNFFYDTVGRFFHEGTNWLIARSIQIGLGTVPGIASNSPDEAFVMIDYAIATAFSAKMFVTIMAMLFTGPYGWLFFLLMILGLGSFVAALFQAIWIYLMAMVVRAFLFGLAPLFFPFLLFSRTRHLFDGWLNQLVNTMLQPVLLFTFFSFFVVLVQAAMENILNARVCILPGAGLFDGLPGDVQLWRPTIDGEPFTGSWGWRGPIGANGPVFFINIVDVITFILLTQLAWRFNSIAINIAKEIAGVSTTFNIPGEFSNIMSPRHAATSRAMSAANREFSGTQTTNRAALEAAKAAGGNAGAAIGGGGGGVAPKPGQIPPTRK